MSGKNPAAGRLLNLQRRDDGEPIINLVRTPAFATFMRNGDFAEPVEIEAPNQPGRLLQFSANHFGANEVALVVQNQRRRAVSDCSLGIGTCNYSELTVPEAAEVLEIPLNTAYSRLCLARQAFEAALLRHQARSGERRR